MNKCESRYGERLLTRQQAQPLRATDPAVLDSVPCSRADYACRSCHPEARRNKSGGRLPRGDGHKADMRNGIFLPCSRADL